MNLIKKIKRIWYGQRKQPEVIIHQSGKTIEPVNSCKDFNEWSRYLFLNNKKQTT